MKIKHFFNILLIFTLFITCVTPVKAKSEDNSGLNLPKMPVISSSEIVLMDADSGQVLYGNNIDKKTYPASTTKLLTGLLTVENCTFTDTITFSKAAVGSIEPGYANAAIQVGEQLTIEQALYCLILRSANEVAYGLAEHVSGTVSEFAAAMNNYAEELGCKNTHFTNASGLSDEFHYTTPYDMALIAKACFNNKSLMKIIGYSGIYTIGPTNKSNFTRYYTHRYQMLPDGDYPYKYSCGGKTGYTDAAGSCLVSFAQKDDLRLICVVMNGDDVLRYRDSAALFDYYFDNYKKIFLNESNMGLNSSGTDILNIVSSLSPDNRTGLSFPDDAYILVPNKITASDLTGIVTYADNAAYMGDEGGFACISYYYNNINVGQATIYISENVPDNSVSGADGIPAIYNNTAKNSTKSTRFVNIFYIIGGIGAVGILVFVIIYLTKIRKRRRKYSSKRLRF